MQERLFDRRWRTEAERVTAVRAPVYAEFYFRQKRRAFDTGGGEIRARCEGRR